MSKEPYVNPERGVIVGSSSNQGALVTNTKASPTQAPIRDFSFTKIHPWGLNNLFPQEVLADVQKSTVIGGAIEKKAKLLYAGGIQYGYIAPDPTTGDEKFYPKRLKSVEAWLSKTNYKRTLYECIIDYYHFANFFPELILDDNHSQILNIAHQEATDCRWSKRNPESGLVETCYINSQWEIENENSVNTRKLPVIDPYYDRVTSLKLRNDSKRYIYPASSPSPGKHYYQLATWNASRKGGWFQQSMDIPAVKNAILKNQGLWKYIIYVPEWWWEWKFGKQEWAKMQATPGAVEAAQRKELDKFERLLTGIEGAGKSIMITVMADPVTKKVYEGWKIEPLDDKIKDGKYIEDSQEANSHMLFSLGVPQAILGNSPSSSGMGAGSGSDVREYTNSYLSLLTADIDAILEPFNLMAEFNGFAEEMANTTGGGVWHSRFLQPYLQTLNQVNPTQRDNVKP